MTQSIEATTTHGKVRGSVEDGIHAFKGIRYGADTRPRRFMPPVAPEPWKKPVDATGHGAAAPQSGKETEPMSEDCLFLNVWTPGLRDGAKRPVLSYIHGGAYSLGETRLLIGGSDPADFSLSWDQLPDKLASNMRAQITPEKVVAAYRKWYPDYWASDVFFSAAQGT